MGPPPAAALTLTTVCPVTAPLSPCGARSAGARCPGRLRNLSEPPAATGTLLRPQAQAPLPAAVSPALGRSLRKRAPFPDRSGRTAPGRSHAWVPFKVFESARRAPWLAHVL